MYFRKSLSWRYPRTLEELGERPKTLYTKFISNNSLGIIYFVHSNLLNGNPSNKFIVIILSIILSSFDSGKTIFSPFPSILLFNSFIILAILSLLLPFSFYNFFVASNDEFAWIKSLMAIFFQLHGVHPTRWVQYKKKIFNIFWYTILQVWEAIANTYVFNLSVLHI